MSNEQYVAQCERLCEFLNEREQTNYRVEDDSPFEDEVYLSLYDGDTEITDDGQDSVLDRLKQIAKENGYYPEDCELEDTE